MNAKQARFVAEYVKDLNATQAAIRCGYSQKTAKVQGSRLLTIADVWEAVQAKLAKQLEKAELSAARVLEEYRRLAFCDTRLFWHPDGRLKAMHELTPEQGSALAGFEAIIKNAKAGDGVTDEIHKIKLWDKTKALDSLAQHFGLLEEKFDITAEMVIRWGK